MSLQKLMHNYAHYNLWANKTLADWLSASPLPFLKQSIPSSFPSILQTCSHLWDTEVFWLAVLQGTANQSWATNSSADHQVIPGLLQQSEAVASYVNGLNESDLIKACHIDTPWVKGQMPRYEFIQHCINHATYHRGQIITLAHTLGIPNPPTTDYNYFNMIEKSNG